ncbi:hypothetical protein PRIPAC_91087 [Pristionchus pacificus]|uniref:Uncharacterized protein n=1 Tax=Pristionchus pacificus TaxID=54126 RepID=A0A2A6CV86_PRIPA|nr:hypothetical protein PRIPAC_91087 [Pristionchus pacificus]|eukprot:PDM82038.1 hypothetical protein PRIPAC_36431 [Pristionchus pacificus]
MDAMGKHKRVFGNLALHLWLHGWYLSKLKKKNVQGCTHFTVFFRSDRTMDSMLIVFIFSFLLESASSLVCNVNGSAADERWANPIVPNEVTIIASFSNITFSYGAMKCPIGLDRCMRFSPSPISSLLSFDAAKGQPTFADLFLNMSGAVSGYACASQKDCVEIKAANLSSCRNSTGSCCCSSDGCTGSGRDSWTQTSLVITSIVLIIGRCD